MTANRVQQTPSPRTDAAKVDLRECISVERIETGRRQYVEEYVPVNIARQLEIELAGLRAKVEAETIERCLNCYSPDDSASDWADKMRALKKERP